MVIDRLMQRQVRLDRADDAVICSVVFRRRDSAARQDVPAVVPAIVQVLSYTPPFGAAAAMTQSGAAVLYGFAIELVWLAGLSAALVALEKRPPQRHVVATTAMSFDSPFDRVGAALGFDNAPAGRLVAALLRAQQPLQGACS